MTEQIREQVSALVDGEASRDEIGLLVRRLERDPALRRQFGTHVLVGETLRAPGGLLASPGFAARVAAAIDSADAPVEVPVRAAAPRMPVRWARPALAGTAAAAIGAAAVMLFAAQQDATDAPVIAIAPAGSERPQSVVAAGMTPEIDHMRLANYLVAHSQFSSSLGRRNVLSGLLSADPGITRINFEQPAEAR